MAGSAQCTECGLIHPPVAKGHCPIANVNKVKEDLKSEKNLEYVNVAIEVQNLFNKKFHGLPEEKKLNFCDHIKEAINKYG